MNILRKGLSMILVLAMVLAIVPVYAVPETAEPEEEVIFHKPVVPSGYTGIYSKQDLDAVRNDLGGKYILMCDLVFTEEDFSEGGAFYNDGQLWLPIGPGEETPFSGEFDGNNYVVRNLQVNSARPDLEWNFAGLFGYNTGTIHNLGMEDGKIVADEATWAACAGAVTGWNAGDIYECFNTGFVYANVSGTAEDGYLIAMAGGISGYNSNGTIVQCYNQGEIYAEAENIAQYPRALAGGIVAENKDSMIQQCANYGHVLAEGVYRQWYYDTFVGGIAGHVPNGNSFISECCNHGVVKGNGNYTGGIAGYLGGDGASVQNCYNAGRVYLDEQGSWDGSPGGIVGYNTGFIADCYSVGEAKRDGVQYWRATIGLVGIDNEGSYSHNYYPDTFDKGVDEHIVDNVTVYEGYNGTALSWEAMTKAESYADFDFDINWKMGESEDYPYPVLKNAVKIRSNTHQFAGGRGTLEDPFKIATAEHLRNLDQYTSAYFVLTEDISFAKGQLFAPLCQSEKRPFYGQLDGAGHRIENLQILVQGRETELMYAGLFAYLSGTVKDLELKGGSVRLEMIGETSLAGYVGALAGYAERAQIENVVNSAMVEAYVIATAFRATPSAYAGGIVGYGGTLKSCYNSGKVFAVGMVDTQYAPVIAHAYAGGIAAKNTRVENCTNTGDVLAEAVTYTEEKHPDYTYYSGSQLTHAGGIVADTTLLIAGCTNLGTVEAKTSGKGSANTVYSNAGGIVAYCRYNDNEETQTGIINCANAGAVTASQSAYENYVGGIAGKANNVKIENCINSGVITGYVDVGGIAGQAYGENITLCRNIGPVKGMYVAGIVAEGGSMVISRCANEGTLLTTNNAYGIVGTGGNTTVTNCYNAGQFIAFSNSGYIFGITSFDHILIDACYNVGQPQSATGNQYGIGGATADNTYYIDAYPKEDNGAISCTDQQMQQQETYYGFDFGTTWTFDTEGGYPYPVLQGLPAATLENTWDFLGGYGTEEHPYLIENTTHLNNIRYYPGCYFRLVANVEFVAADYATDGDFYNGGTYWQSIGADKNDPFIGNLDGNGFGIYNLQISRGEGTYLGLFGYNLGTVKNLTLGNVRISSHTQKDVTAKHSEDTIYAGAVAGYSSGELEGIRVTGKITVTADYDRIDSSEYCYFYVGGLTGKSEDHKLTDCVNAAEIVVTVNMVTTTDFDESLDDSPGMRTFGVGATAYVGGITASAKNVTIDSCRNEGKITIDLVTKGTADKSCDHSSTSIVVGGIVGYGETVEISRCANVGDIAASAKTTSNTGIHDSGRASVTAGGIVGETSSWGTTGKIAACANLGNLKTVAITSGNNTELDCNTDVGGLAGYYASGTITDSFNAGNIEASNSAKYYGSVDVGGLAGVTRGAVSNCYNIGYLDVWHTENHRDSYCEQGAIAGAIYGSDGMTNCYYLDRMSTGTGWGTDTAVRCSYQQLMDKATYAGFSFGDVWTMDGQPDYAYPELKDVPFSKDKWVVGLVLAKQPDKLEYLAGIETELDMTGAEVVLLYSDGSTETVYLHDVSFDSRVGGTPGEVTIKLSYSGYETAVTVTVVEPEAQWLEIIELPDRMEYTPGESLDITGLKIMAHYANDVSALVYSDDLEVDYVDIYTTGEKTVTIRYQGKTVEFTVLYKYAGPDAIISDVYRVGDQYVTAVPAGTTVEQFMEGFQDSAYLYVFSGDEVVSYDSLVGTGMELMLNGAQEIWLTIIVTGDINGDGKISVTDYIQFKSHLLGKSTLVGEQTLAADVNGDGGISVTDYIQFKAHLLGKNQITPK